MQFLEDIPRVTSEYRRVRRTLPASASLRIIVEALLWPIDGLSRDILTSQLEGFHQKNKESVRDFRARFFDFIDSSRVFDPEITDKQVRDQFKTNRHLSKLIPVNLPADGTYTLDDVMCVAEPIQKAFNNLIPTSSVPIVTDSKTAEPAVNAFSFKQDAANKRKIRIRQPRNDLLRKPLLPPLLRAAPGGP